MDGLQRKDRVVLEADMGEGLDTARRRDGQRGQRPAAIEAVPDQARELGGNALVGRIFQQAMQRADFGKSLRQTRFAAQLTAAALPVAYRNSRRSTVLTIRAHRQARPLTG